MTRRTPVNAEKTQNGDHPPPQQAPTRSFETIVDDYIHRWRPQAQGYDRWFARMASLEDAIDAAAMSCLPNGKRHPHQYRVGVECLAAARRTLLAVPLRDAASFDDLFQMTHEAIGGINGIGELAVYDIATRIGAFLGLEPERVYLHAGTREGAHALGFRRRECINPAELPDAFQRLSASEIEDCLCLYKDRLKEIAAASNDTHRPMTDGRWRRTTCPAPF